MNKTISFALGLLAGILSVVILSATLVLIFGHVSLKK
jgi:hypothetical protein